LRTKQEWINWASSQDRPVDIPENPDKI